MIERLINNATVLSSIPAPPAQWNLRVGGLTVLNNVYKINKKIIKNIIPHYKLLAYGSRNRV